MTYNQSERQNYRNNQNGQYTEIQKCELCDKPVGLNYCSLDDCNVNGHGLVLHEKCCKHLEGLFLHPAERLASYKTLSIENKKIMLDHILNFLT